MSVAPVPEPEPVIRRTVTEAIAEVIRRTATIEKDSFNAQQKYAFRSYDRAVGAVRRAMADVGLVMLPTVESYHVDERPRDRGVWRTATVEIRYRLVGPDGDEVEIVTVGEGSDAGDKALNKALTAAHKYALFQTFLLSGDADDSDATDGTHPPVDARTETPDDVARRIGFEHDDDRRSSYERFARERQRLDDEQRDAMGVWVADHDDWPAFGQWHAEHFEAALRHIDEICPPGAGVDEEPFEPLDEIGKDA